MEKPRVKPQAGQESVWDYPRPPRVEDSPRHIQVVFNRVLVADTRHAQRVLETSHPPVYYLPPEDIRMEYLVPTGRVTYCEWKGQAAYYSLVVNDRRADNAAWFYPAPSPGYEAIQNYVAFYAHLMEACTIDGERVRPQPGGFYGGWITNDIVGPFKGGPRTWGW